jgi:hypothetical protein
MIPISMAEWGFAAGRFGVVLVGLIFVLFWSCGPEDPRRIDDFPVSPECWRVPAPSGSGVRTLCKYELPDGAICYAYEYAGGTGTQPTLSCSR